MARRKQPSIPDELLDRLLADGDPKEALASAAKKIDQDIEDNDGYPPFGGK